MAGSSDDTISALKPVRWYRDLLKIKGRMENGAFLIEGDRAIAQVINNHPDAVMEILSIDVPDRIYDNFATRSITGGQLHSISSTKTPQGTIAVVRIPANTYTDTLPGKTGDRLLLLEDIQDPGNTGTLIRTAAAFGFSGIIMTDKCADPFSPKCVQATAGAGLSVWIRRTGRYMDIAEKLLLEGFTLAAADLGGTEAPSVLSRRGKLILALGNEASGMSAMLLKLATIRVKVPIARDKIDSLNVAACGAICMYLASGIK
jgi:TrmH family RNA methyltransferase